MFKTVLLNIPAELYNKTISFLNGKKVDFNEWIISLINEALRKKSYPTVETLTDITFDAKHSSSPKEKINSQ